MFLVLVRVSRYMRQGFRTAVADFCVEFGVVGLDGWIAVVDLIWP